MKKKAAKKSKKPEKSLLDKAINLVEKSDDFLEKKVKQVKKSKTFKKATGKIKDLEGFVGDKMDDIEKSKGLKKLGKMVDKVGDKAESSYNKLKKLGKDLSETRVTVTKVKKAPAKKALKPVKKTIKAVKTKVQTSPVTRKVISRRAKSK